VSKHTPGPWEWVGWTDHKLHGHSNRWDILHRPMPNQPYGSLGPVLTCGMSGQGDDYWINVSPADAALIAAAPDLLDALKHVVGVVEDEFGINATFGGLQNARVAVSKAEGDAK
jgi:hypothetical protein